MQTYIKKMAPKIISALRCVKISQENISSENFILFSKFLTVKILNLKFSALK